MISIYKISSTNPEILDFYIGSTNKISSRKSHHKKNVRNKVGKRYWTKLYVFIRNNGGWDAFKMEVIEQTELGKEREQYYIDLLNPTLNTNRAVK